MTDRAANKGLLVVISGPSGAGKTSVCRWLYEQPGVVASVSMTTRKPRPTEVDGRDYFFTTEDDFRAKVAQGFFLEWAEVFGNLYGTPRNSAMLAVEAGRICILEIDVQGGQQVLRACPDVVSIFIEPPSFDEVVKRLSGRKTESAEQVARRLQEFETEMSQGRAYGHHVVNDDLEVARRRTWDIIQAARR